MTNLSIVTVRTTKRYYYGGRGYNSELAAYMQMAKWEISSQCHRDLDAELRQYGHVWDLTEEQREARWQAIQGWDSRWYAKRYPARPGCNCSFCQGRTLASIPHGLGCWLSKMADYRRLAREIIVDIRLGFRNADGRKTLALPVRSAA